MLDLYLSQHLGKLYALIRSKALVQVGWCLCGSRSHSLQYSVGFCVVF